MAGVELDRVELLRVGAAGPHEGQRPVDLARQPLVALAGRAGSRDEVLVPGVDLAQVGVAARGERPAQVQRHRRAVVGAQQPAGVGRAGLRGELEAVDRVAAVGGQLDAVADLGVPRARLGVLAGHPADLDDRHARAVGQHDGHLQHRLQLGAHGVGGGARERLRAVTALQHERLAAGHRGQPLPELIALAGEDQRRQRGQLGGHRRSRRRGRASPAAAPAGRPRQLPIRARGPAAGMAVPGWRAVAVGTLASGACRRAGTGLPGARGAGPSVTVSR